MPAVRAGVRTRRLAIGASAKRAGRWALSLVATAVLGMCATGFCSAPILGLHDVAGETVRMRIASEDGPPPPPEVRTSPWLAYAAKSAFFVGLGLVVLHVLGRYSRYHASRAKTREAREFLGEIAIGEDGVRITRLRTPEFVSYARVLAVERAPGAVVLVLADGARRTLPAAEPDELAGEIDEARARYAPVDSRLPDDPDLLSSAGALLSRAYREHALTPEELADHASAIGAPPHARIAAALALSRDPALAPHVARVRESLRSMANEDLALAIESALLYAPDPALIEKGLRA